MSNKDTDSLAFQKARDGLWNSLQNHLSKLYETEEAFNKCLTFADTYPFDKPAISAESMEEYWRQRKGLRNLFIDEVNQLDSLIKAVRHKGYKEGDKKHLFLLILGYMDVLEATTEGLYLYVPKSLPKDEELVKSKTNFNRLIKFVRLNIRGILPVL
jgi:hypothetical protein